MRYVLLATLCAWSFAALAQKPDLPELPGADKPPAKADDKKKKRPRITVRQKGGTGSSVGDDASGGGARNAEPSKGGTPGTPSGSFTGSAPKP